MILLPQTLAGSGPRVEELEVDHDVAKGAQSKRFLAACGIRAPQSAELLHPAETLLERHPAAILRAELSRDNVKAAVSSAGETHELSGDAASPKGDAAPPRAVPVHL